MKTPAIKTLLTVSAGACLLVALVCPSDSRAGRTSDDRAVAETPARKVSPGKQRRQSRRCFIRSCLDPIRACKASEACSDWLACMDGCDDDPMLCPTVCGAFYQAPEVNDFTRCALENACIEIDFSGLPACAAPEGEPAEVGVVDGFWWVSAIDGHDYVLYDDCQRFVLTELDDARIDVENSTHVSHQGETRVVQNLGTFTRRDDGSLELVYDNWVGYRELYRPLYATERVLVAHVCSQDTTGSTHDYGTLVLTRSPLEELASDERRELDERLEGVLDRSLAEFRRIGTSGCSNGP